jgi:hypothetical protein
MKLQVYWVEGREDLVWTRPDTWDFRSVSLQGVKLDPGLAQMMHLCLHHPTDSGKYFPRKHFNL